MADRSFRNQLTRIVALAAVLRIAAWIVGLLDRTLLVTWRLPDDALYYFSIAKHLTFTTTASLLSADGIHATNGMHPLWVFFIAPIWALGLHDWSAIQAALLLQSLLDCVAVLLIGHLVYKLLDGLASEPNRRTAALMSAAIYACSAVMIIRGINGLETTLTICCLLLWIEAIWRCNTTPSRWLVLGITTALSFLARTDSIILMLPAFLWLWMNRPSRTATIRALLIALLLVAPWLLWNLHHFDTIFQSSGLAVPFFAMKKYAAIYSPIGTYWHLTLLTAKAIAKPWVVAGLGLPFFALIYTARRYPSKRGRTQPMTTFLVAIATGCALLLATHGFVRGFVREWYELEQLPIILIIFGIAVARNAEPHNVRRGGRFRLAAIIILATTPFAIAPAYPSQQLMVHDGVPTIQRLTQTARVAALNSGYYSYFAAKTGAVTNLDGVVNTDAYQALRTASMERYLLRDSATFILDFKNDLGGYRALIDANLLRDFHPVDSFADPTLPSKLMLYKRNDVDRPKDLTSPN